MSKIHVPFVVVHGSEDPLLPPAHGRALADAVPGASLVILEGGGHGLEEGDWDKVLAVILR